jgi:hypothetical protein
MEKGMSLKSSTYAAAAAVALFGTTAILDASPASARCRGAIVRGELTSGTLQTLTEISARSKWRSAVRVTSGTLQTLTEISARSKWRSAVRARYGSSYSRWGLAENKNMDCKKGEPGRRWHCRASARPCDGRG